MRDVAAVVDSGSLICLARIDQLELLPDLFAKILVPPEVMTEVTVRGGNRFEFRHPSFQAKSS